MKKTEIIVVCIALLLVSFVFGCQSPTKVWGKGELPTEWQGYFGKDNKARLDYIQTDNINKQGQMLAGINERLRKLEDVEIPKGPQ